MSQLNQLPRPYMERGNSCVLQETALSILISEWSTLVTLSNGSNSEENKQSFDESLQCGLCICRHHCYFDIKFGYL